MGRPVQRGSDGQYSASPSQWILRLFILYLIYCYIIHRLISAGRASERGFFASNLEELLSLLRMS